MVKSSKAMRKSFLTLLIVIMFGCQPEQETPQYSLKTSSNPTNGGTIVPSSGQYYEGEIVEIKAEANTDYVFHSWSGSVSGSSNTISVEMNSDKDIEANFYNEKYDLTLDVFGEGEVTSKLIVPDSFSTDVIVELTATPTGDWEFVEWSGDITSTENPVEVNFDSPKNITATFTRNFDYSNNSHNLKNELNPFWDIYHISGQFSFEPPTYGGYDTGVAYADFNMDGYLDIHLMLDRFGDGTPNESFMLLNDGNDSFILDQSLITNNDFGPIRPRKTIVGDFNGDSKPDVVRPGGGHGYKQKPNILLSNGDHYTFEFLSNAPEMQAHTVSSGDIDNDGDLDLFFGHGSAVEDGFMINDGSGNFSWSPIVERINNYSRLDDGILIGMFGIWTSEMLDVNFDGNIDLILADNRNDPNDTSTIPSPLILWGDGSGNYDYQNRTEIYNDGHIPLTEDSDESMGNDATDISFYDIDNDGVLDAFILSTIFVTYDNYQSNTIIQHKYEIHKGISTGGYINMTDEWLPNSDKECTAVWLLIKDVDGNGRVDLTEYSRNTMKNGVSECPTEEYRWEWNGSSFITVHP